MQLLKKHFDVALESPDGIKKLRELILTLAMQGKLVKQDPKDQPASELLKEIKAEKERLIKEGKIKKQKPLPEIKSEEVPYDVPDGWVWTRLGTAMNKITDGTHNSPPNFDNGDYLYISAKNIKENGVMLSNATYVSADVHNEIYARCNPQYGDILYIKDGATTGITTINNLEEPFSMLSSVALLKSSKKIFNKFLLFLLRSPFFYSQMRSEMTGVAITRVTIKKLMDSKVPFPPLPEQKRIVAKIDELMALCDKLEEQRKIRDEKRLAVHTSAMNRLLNASGKREFNASWKFITRHFEPIYSVKENVIELKKAILTLAMQGKLVKQNPKDQPASELLKEIKAEKERLIEEGKIKKQKPLPEIKPEEMPYEVPEGWVWTRLGEILQFINGDRGKNYPSKDKLSTKGIPFISAVNLQSGTVSKDNLLCVNKDQFNKLGSGKLNKNDIVFCIRGSLGKSAIYPFNSGAIASSLVILRQFNFNIDTLLYLNQYISSQLLFNEINKYDNGTAQPNLSANNFMNFLCPIPPFPEQKRIVAKIDELMALCDKLEQQIEMGTQKQTQLFEAILAKI
ncbi:restriction endonuclease subunit S [Candidatus Parabeggiatoa sp. HSG14]|uniref:restriction endonuclease subunit S n=1 Tax=Candidatus Parabeggiatoa sp. HSG14 TaxID=3055593 RepID=UPI0025A924B3|nr:restriction endonuclease subunit S [Thiotrichales bacterium HSG14]